MHGDVARAAAVADDVATAADLDRRAGAMTSERARTRAAEKQDLRGAIGDPGFGFDGEEQVVTDDGWGVGPGAGDSTAEAIAIRGGADAGHADADAVRLGR